MRWMFFLQNQYAVKFSHAFAYLQFCFSFSDNGSECSDISVTEKERYSGDPRSSSPLPISPSDIGPEDWDAELEASPPYGKKS